MEWIRVEWYGVEQTVELSTIVPVNLDVLR